MLNNDTIATGLRGLAATTTGTGEGPPLLFACWEAQAACAVCKPLPTATAALHAAIAERGPADGMPAMPPASALAGSTLEWVDGSADPLKGIGLLTTGIADAEPATAWVAMPDGMTLIWQSIPAPAQGRPEIPGDASLRIETGTPPRRSSRCSSASAPPSPAGRRTCLSTCAAAPSTTGPAPPPGPARAEPTTHPTDPPTTHPNPGRRFLFPHH